MHFASWTVHSPVVKHAGEIKDATHLLKAQAAIPLEQAVPSCNCMKARKAWILLHGTRL